MTENKPVILVADDEPSIRRVLGAVLEREGYRVVLARDGGEALGLLAAQKIQVVITDLKMPGADGMDVLKFVQKNQPGTPVIIITAHGTIDNAVQALKAGAFDYITKPFEKDQLLTVIAKAVRSENLSRKDFLPADDFWSLNIIGQTPQMKEIYQIVERVADTPSTVLITGESGTGKELIAAALHRLSSRRDQPFIKINCAAIPRELVESELFGHERGAFTGAVATKPGRFELADGGTLFLDEIAEIPVDIQVKLLRAIQDAEFERVGGLQTVKVNVRLVVATNRDLQKEVEAGRFREDLYYRLNVVPIHLPPLRERKQDIPLLVRHFIEKFRQKLSRPVTDISPEALELLVAYRWPGNIRELENVIERCVLFANGPVIQAGDLPQEIRGRQISPPAVAATSGELSMKDIVKRATVELERDLIQQALKQTGWNVTQAARQLKISRKSLQLKMKELGLREKQ